MKKIFYSAIASLILGYGGDITTAQDNKPNLESKIFIEKDNSLYVIVSKDKISQPGENKEKEDYPAIIIPGYKRINFRNVYPRDIESSNSGSIEIMRGLGEYNIINFFTANSDSSNFARNIAGMLQDEGIFDDRIDRKELERIVDDGLEVPNSYNGVLALHDGNIPDIKIDTISYALSSPIKIPGDRPIDAKNNFNRDYIARLPWGILRREEIEMGFGNGVYDASLFGKTPFEQDIALGLLMNLLHKEAGYDTPPDLEKSLVDIGGKKYSGKEIVELRRTIGRSGKMLLGDSYSRKNIDNRDGFYSNLDFPAGDFFSIYPLGEENNSLVNYNDAENNGMYAHFGRANVIGYKEYGKTTSETGDGKSIVTLKFYPFGGEVRDFIYNKRAKVKK